MTASSKDKDWKEIILGSWATLNANLNECEEAECLQLLNYEKKTKKRLLFMLRIYGRYNKLRGLAERKELIQLAGEQ